MKAILIGRHTGAIIPGIEVDEQRAVNWPATAEECRPVLAALLDDAAQNENIGAVIFQAVPGQLAVALHREITRLACLGSLMTGVSDARDIRIGIVISKLSARPAGVEQAFYIPDLEEQEAIAGALDVLAGLAEFANPNVKIERHATWIDVTVDPPMRFEFSHIEWL